MKKCIQCEQSKDLTEFYKHAKMADGHLNKCKSCCRSAANDNRAANIEEKRAYDRRRGNQAKRVAARARYSKTEKGRAAVAAAKARFIERNPIKRAAHIAVGNALRSGALVKQPCEVCQAIDVHGHHDDYGFPLTVRWLCPQHHADWHKENEPRFTGCAA